MKNFPLRVNSSGVPSYQLLSYFGPQIHDRFSNIVIEDPKPEIKIIEISAETILSSNFLIVSREQKVKIAFNTMLYW